MKLKACLVTVASLSVLAAGATAAWPISPVRSSNSTASSSDLRLLVSASADRSNARNLHRGYLSGKVAIFTNHPSRVRSMAFYLDDPRMRRPPRQVDRYWPFDFAGSASGGNARLFDTSNLTAGRHLVTAKAVLTNGARVVKTAAFYKPDRRTSPDGNASSADSPARPPRATIRPQRRRHAVGRTIDGSPSISTSKSHRTVAPSTSTTTTPPITTVTPKPPTVAPSTSTSETIRPVIKPSTVAPSTSTPTGGSSRPNQHPWRLKRTRRIHPRA